MQKQSSTVNGYIFRYRYMYSGSFMQGATNSNGNAYLVQCTSHKFIHTHSWSLWTGWRGAGCCSTRSTYAYSHTQTLITPKLTTCGCAMLAKELDNSNDNGNGNGNANDKANN